MPCRSQQACLARSPAFKAGRPTVDLRVRVSVSQTRDDKEGMNMMVRVTLLLLAIRVVLGRGKGGGGTGGGGNSWRGGEGNPGFSFDEKMTSD